MENKEEIIGYVCPICDTPNPISTNYCVKCGHWLLDADSSYTAKPITKKGLKKYFSKADKDVPEKKKGIIISVLLILMGLYLLGSVNIKMVLSLSVILFGLISIIKPLRSIGISTRSKGLATLAIGVVVLFISAASLPHSTQAMSNQVAPAVSPVVKPAEQTNDGQVAELGQFGFKVLSAESSKEAKTTTKSISVTNNMYEIVKIEFTNERSAPAQIGDFEFKLLDKDKNSTYGMNSNVTIDMDSTMSIIEHQKQAAMLYDNVNPNLKKEFTMVFEVPNEANYALEIAYKKDSVTMNLK